jgi:hypothetical protein
MQLRQGWTVRQSRMHRATDVSTIQPQVRLAVMGNFLSENEHWLSLARSENCTHRSSVGRLVERRT